MLQFHDTICQTCGKPANINVGYCLLCNSPVDKFYTTWRPGVNIQSEQELENESQPVAA